VVVLLTVGSKLGHNCFSNLIGIVIVAVQLRVG
jgi:hypothetical protein